MPRVNLIYLTMGDLYRRSSDGARERRTVTNHNTCISRDKPFRKSKNLTIVTDK